MFFIVVIMGIVVIAFGVPKQGILHPHEEPSIALAQAVVFRPYWMMYGEMFAYEIDRKSSIYQQGKRFLLANHSTYIAIGSSLCWAALTLRGNQVALQQ